MQLIRLIKEQWANYTGGRIVRRQCKVFYYHPADIVFCSFATIMNHQLTGSCWVNSCSKTHRGYRRINQRRRRVGLCVAQRLETQKDPSSLCFNKSTNYLNMSPLSRHSFALARFDALIVFCTPLYQP